MSHTLHIDGHGAGNDLHNFHAQGGATMHPEGSNTDFNVHGGISSHDGHAGGSIGGGMNYHPDSHSSIGIQGTVSSGGDWNAGIGGSWNW